jgi:7,8-dihydropterin-6-yl-methyl-4-(beta-D-ribofuranosyl)aminobenzene 5'-phosphate synthase
MADIRITVLVENTAGKRGLLAEHGLAYWIEIKDKKILFDTGQGNVLFRNARRLGIRLEKTDAVALSHGHYDHTGGLYDLLHATGKISLYAHPEAFQPKYACSRDGISRDVAFTHLGKMKVSEMAKFISVEEPVVVADGLRLTGTVPRKTDFEDTGGAFYKDQGCKEPDELMDDQAAFVETPLGTVVILGCAHAGVINTLERILELTEHRPIHIVMGGMHLHAAGPERLDKTVEAFRRMQIKRLLPCHCTGFEAMVRLWNEFPGRCETCHVGKVIEI